MKFKEDNIFLAGANGGILYGPRKDFKDTDKGNNRIDVCSVAFYGDSNYNNNAILPRDGKYVVEI